MIKVLVVDNEKLVRKGIVLEINWLSLVCIVVGEASNRLEAIEFVNKYNPDLIITDIRIPKMDGIQMLTRLREEKNDIEVIFLTANNDFLYAQKAIKLLAVDYLLKPFEDGELEEVILPIKDKIMSKKKYKDNKEEIDIEIKSGKKSIYYGGY